jgi:hypothetical protein
MRSFDVATFVLVPLLAFGVSGCSCGSDDSSDGSGSGGSSGAGVGGDGGTGGAEASTGGGGTAGVSDAGEDVSDAGGDVVVDAAPDAEPMCSSAKPCTWKQATPTSSPPVLAWAAAAYDPVNDQTILFGGAPTINGGGTTNETWAWNGTTWTKLLPVSSPDARWTHGMAYDANRKRIVLFGGLSGDQAASALNDTWEWDGSDWSEITTTNAPAPRGIHGSIAYDSLHQNIVVRGGGTLPGETLYDDTWTYDGTDWTEVAGAGPSPRVAPALAFDEVSGELVLFGGGTWNPYYADTWTFDGSVWTELTPAPNPSPSLRQSARMIYDSTRSVTLLFGGYDGTLLNDLWEWNGTAWSLVNVTPPPPRCCFAFAHDTKRGEAIVFGGPDNQTWIYGN